MPYTLKRSKITMYADDTPLAYSARSVSDISNVMNFELESLRKWLYSDKLSLIAAKALSILIGKGMHCKIKTMGNYFGQILRYQKKLLSERHELNIWVFKLMAS